MPFYRGGGRQSAFRHFDRRKHVLIFSAPTACEFGNPVFRFRPAPAQEGGKKDKTLL
jgi:hypothetical protein